MEEQKNGKNVIKDVTKLTDKEKEETPISFISWKPNESTKVIDLLNRKVVVKYDAITSKQIKKLIQEYVLVMFGADGNIYVNEKR